MLFTTIQPRGKMLSYFHILHIGWRRMIRQVFLCWDVFRSFWSVPPFVALIWQFGDCDMHGLALLKFGGDGTQAVGDLISLKRNHLTLNIRNMDEMLLSWVLCWLYVSMASGFAEVCHCATLNFTLNPLWHWISSDPSWQQGALQKKAAWLFKAWAKTWVWTWNTAWSSSSPIWTKIVQTSGWTVERLCRTSDGNFG